MDGRKIRILLVDDQEDDAYLTHRALMQLTTPRYDVARAVCLTEAAEKVCTQAFDIVLLDLGLPESTGIETLRKFRQACEQVLPIIVLTGLCDEEVALRALDEGAQDYLVKDEVNPDTLSRSVRYSLQRHHIKQELAEANNLLKEKNDRLSQLYETAQQFVDNVSHEFRTPLTVIREFTSIVRDGLDGAVTPQQCDHLDKVIHRSDDLALMVDDMLDISKLEAGLLSVWRRPCHAGDLLRSVSGMLTGRAASKSIDLRIDISPELPLLYCDEEKASRVIINLAVNALKFAPADGEVRIWAQPGKDGSEVVIGVTDSGPGISPENLASIFERFQQVENNIRSSTKGFGLGLNIAKELVALNFGQMGVESTLGKGSTFTFTLPCCDSLQLFDKYVRRAVSHADTEASLSIISVALESTASDSAPVVDEFLQRVVRGNDLVLSSSEQTWVIIAQCPEQEITDLVGRIEKEWQDYLRNCPSSELSQINFAHAGNWSLPGDLQQLRTAFANLLTDEKVDARRKVLVVDDNPDVNHCLGMRLEAAGFEVFSAADGEEGLAAVNEHSPDAVVLDVRMPNMDGMEMLEKLRMNNSSKDTPVVMLSASVRDQNHALEAGANFFVPKPYLASTVLSAIESSMSPERKV